MNRSQRLRLEKLEQAAARQGSTHFHNSEPEEGKHSRRYLTWRQRLLEISGRDAEAAKNVIDPTPTPEELQRADEFIDALRQASLRNIYERDEIKLPFNQWLDAQGIERWE